MVSAQFVLPCISVPVIIEMSSLCFAFSLFTHVFRVPILSCSHSSSWVFLSVYLYVCMLSWRITLVFQSSFSVICQCDGLSHVRANRCRVSYCLIGPEWFRSCVGMASRHHVCSGPSDSVVVWQTRLVGLSWRCNDMCQHRLGIVSCLSPTYLRTSLYAYLIVSKCFIMTLFTLLIVCLKAQLNPDAQTLWISSCWRLVAFLRLCVCARLVVSIVVLLWHVYLAVTRCMVCVS